GRGGAGAERAAGPYSARIHLGRYVDEFAATVLGTAAAGTMRIVVPSHHGLPHHLLPGDCIHRFSGIPRGTIVLLMLFFSESVHNVTLGWRDDTTVRRLLHAMPVPVRV